MLHHFRATLLLQDKYYAHQKGWSCPHYLQKSIDGAILSIMATRPKKYPIALKCFRSCANFLSGLSDRNDDDMGYGG